MGSGSVRRPSAATFLQPRAVRTNAHDFVSGRLLGPHEGENKMVEREIDGAELADFHNVTGSRREIGAEVSHQA